MAALRGPEIDELKTALLSAFERDSLAEMVQTRLDEKLDAIAGDKSLGTVVFNLICWAVKHGKTEDLIQAAFACVPDNPELQEFVRKHNHQPSSQDAAFQRRRPLGLRCSAWPVFGAIAFSVSLAVAMVGLGMPFSWPSLENSLVAAFNPAAQSKPEIKLDAAIIRFVVTRENGDINQYSAGRVMRVVPGSSLLIEMGFAADDTSFSRELAYHYFAARGSVQATNGGHTASYVAPPQPGPDILSVEIMLPDDTFKMTRSLYIWVSE